MALESLEDLLIHELKDLYDAEHQITKALPKLAKAAQSDVLREAFEEHLQQTEAQISRLERVFEAMGKTASRKTCKAMKGIIEEGDEVLKEEMSETVRDAALIAAAQRVEHYEISGYGTARTFAYALGNQEAATLLQETLDEEEQTDKKLTQIANNINLQAMQ
jgi:ferritin-like metal-binding protein YciE